MHIYANMKMVSVCVVNTNMCAHITHVCVIRDTCVRVWYTDVEGEYVDDGYVDESMPSYRQASGQGFFGGLFGNGEAKAAEAAKREQQRKAMDVITFVDPVSL